MATDWIQNGASTLHNIHIQSGFQNSFYCHAYRLDVMESKQTQQHSMQVFVCVMCMYMYIARDNNIPIVFANYC